MIDTGGARAWLIRHGESESNAGLPTNGPGVSPLTPLGRAQAEQVAAAFTEPPSLIVSSTFVRARETAAPTRARFPEVPYEEWPVQEFTYLGELHGPRTTADERRPMAEAYWERADPTATYGGNGESFAALLTRAGAFLERLAARPEERLVAVFTHGLFIRALLWSFATGITTPDEAAMRSYHRFLQVCVTPNGSILELHPGPRVVAGATAHLTTPTPVRPPAMG
ncbi:histidine phosphatase family protein [Spirillospora sp. CA-294931]|uniref:histidine phosphatase family protein n=1 Tax=Spirillospora sp. CA-294931 TaxID=3240042 RepID=UPI003D9267E5